MKLIKPMYLAIFIIFCLSMTVFPAMAAPGDNIALNCKIDSVCDMVGEEEAAYMLVDDDPEYKTKWCSIDHDNPHLDQGPPDVDGGLAHRDMPDDPYHWIILDFESEKTFNSVRLVKASEGERDFGGVNMDAAAFYFEVSSDKTTWTKVLDVTGNGEVPIYEGAFESVTARYLKLTVSAPEADESNPYLAVRLYDLKVFEAEAPVVETVEIVAVAEDNVEAVAEPVVVSAPQTADPITLSLMGTLMSVGALMILKKSKKK